MRGVVSRVIRDEERERTHNDACLSAYGVSKLDRHDALRLFLE